MEERPLQPPAKIFKSEEEQDKVIKLLEERLEKHNNNRKIVQDKLTEILNKLRAQVGELEEGISRELEENFIPEDDRLQSALSELRGNSTTNAPQKVNAELRTIQSYEIIENKEANNDFTTLYELKIEKRTVHEDDHAGLAISGENSPISVLPNTIDKGETPCDPDKSAEERGRLMELLEERIQTHDCNREAVQDKLHEICERLRIQIDELENRVNKELEEKFTFEDNRLQAALNELRGNSTNSAFQKAKAELLVMESYEILGNEGDEKGEEEEDDDDDDDDDDDNDDEEEEDDDEEEEGENDSVEPNFDLTTLCELKAEKWFVPELVEMRKPINVRVASVNRGRVSVQFTCLNTDEERVLSGHNFANPVEYKCLLFKKGNEQESKEEYSLDKNDGNDSSSFTFTPDILEAETTYGTRVKMVVGDSESEWSDEVAEFTTPGFKECCVWKECPDDVDEERKYSVDGGNPRIATIDGGGYCTIIGNTYIPLNKVASWCIKVLKSMNNNGGDIFIGVAPFDINQNDVNYYNYYKCGWYFDCYWSELRSGPPHNYSGKEYGPRKDGGQYVHTGDSVGVVVDTTRGDLSFVLNGVNLVIAYCGIPLDKPLVPCVLLWYQGDSVELTI